MRPSHRRVTTGDATARALGSSWLRLSGLIVLPLLALALLAPDTGEPNDIPQIACLSSEANNWCAPTDNPDVDAEQTRLEVTGLECNEVAVLAKVVVFEFKDHTVKTISFDEALMAKNDGWVQRYCR